MMLELPNIGMLSALDDFMLPQGTDKDTRTVMREQTRIIGAAPRRDCIGIT
jgi:hypothetical protein